jgi:hypothetical protein
LTSSFEKALFSSFTHFFIVSLNLGEFSVLSSLYILVINPLSDGKDFLPFCEQLFLKLAKMSFCFLLRKSESRKAEQVLPGGTCTSGK